MKSTELFLLKEKDGNGMAICLKPETSVVISVSLINELRHLQNGLVEDFLKKKWDDYFTIVWYLDKNVSSKSHGLDYVYIHESLKNKREYLMEDYINKIFDVLFLNYINLGLPIINCSIVNHLANSIFREFFLLNEFCFIRNRNVNGIVDINAVDEFKYLSFSPDIYLKNHYRYFNTFKPEEIRTIIMETQPVSPQLNLNSIKEKFDSVRDETIQKIYSTASKNYQIIKRLAGL